MAIIIVSFNLFQIVQKQLVLGWMQTISFHLERVHWKHTGRQLPAIRWHWAPDPAGRVAEAGLGCYDCAANCEVLPWRWCLVFSRCILGHQWKVLKNKQRLNHNHYRTKLVWKQRDAFVEMTTMISTTLSDFQLARIINQLIVISCQW